MLPLGKTRILLDSPVFSRSIALEKVFHGDAIGDHGMKVELAMLEQRGHLIPGLVHAAAVDALHGDALKDDVFGEVERNRLGGKAEKRDASAAPHDVEGGSNGVGMARPSPAPHPRPGLRCAP